ncbi:DNA/pantothenate metabolism flavoprotein [Mobiluncus holmesii]|uniref:DNA/pantothenate metabolism flavoprotein n=2 Tax=Actinomycetaceae TaxID=2049 RepID=A0A7K0K065_9ACTO|nr:flavoprotein [Mobiluncus porci]MST48853.1 DNA/pantothenate metabolism flavoprotein [Mobiluncus porci]
MILGVGASVSAFKGVEVLRFLTKAGLDVWVCPTRASLQFVGKATWESLSAHPIHVDVFEKPDEITHVSVAERAQAFLVVGATADLMARFRMGLAEEFLTLAAITVDCPRFLAPAMHPTMWNNSATQENVGVLRERGWHFIGPESGSLADRTEGVGRLSEPETIVSEFRAALGW